MGVLITIKKITSNNDIHYYCVQSNDFKFNEPFFIGIDSKARKMYIYRCDIASIPDCFIDLVNLEEASKAIDACAWISQRLIACILVKVLRAFQENIYPNYIDYAA